LHCQHNIFLSA